MQRDHLIFLKRSSYRGRFQQTQRKRVVELMAWNQEGPTKNSIHIKEVDVVIKVNLSMVTQDSGDERSLDKDVCVDHILQ